MAGDLRDWRGLIQERFPDWGTEAYRTRWLQETPELHVGQSISGTVVAVAHFGFWLDIGLEFVALLLITKSGVEPPMQIEDYAQVGDSMDCLVDVVGPNAEIGVREVD